MRPFRRSVLALGAAGAVLAGLAVSPVPASAATVTIAGTVVDEVDGTALTAIQLSLYESVDGVDTRVQFASTDSTGTWQLEIDPEKTYKVHFNEPLSSRYVPEWYSDAADADAATLIDPTEITEPLFTELARGARIDVEALGTDERGYDGVQEVTLYRDGPDGWQVFSRVEAPVFSALAVPTGRYRVGFSTDLGETYWDEATEFDDADVIELGEFDTTTVQAVFGVADARGYMFVGEKRADGFDVALWKRSNGAWTEVGRPTVTDNGEFAFDDVGPGEYTLFSPAQRSHPAQFLGGAETIENADTFEIDVFDSDVDFVLEPLTPAIMGVVEEFDGEPVSGVRVSRYAYSYPDFTPRFVDATTTDEDGYYRIEAAPGEWFLRFEPPAPYAEQWWRDRATLGEPILMTDHDVTADIDLAEAVTVPGAVVDEEGSPVADATVSVIDPLTLDVLQPYRAPDVATDGTFVMTDLHRTTYLVEADAPGFAPGVARVSAATELDPPIVVELTRVPRLSGTVLGESGVPLEAEITVLDDDLEPVASARSDADGAYAVELERAGEYHVYVEPVRTDVEPGGDLSVGAFWGGGLEPTDAVSIGAGEWNGDITLPAGAYASGVVTDADGPLENVEVTGATSNDATAAGAWRAVSATTDATGFFEMVLPLRDTIIKYRSVDRLFRTEWWRNAHSRSDADLLRPAGDAEYDLSARLTAGATATGTVRIDGERISDAEVLAYRVSRKLKVLETTTAVWSGSRFAVGLPSNGTWIIAAYPTNNPARANTFFGDTTVPSQASRHRVFGADRPYVFESDIRLRRGHSLSGTVSKGSEAASGRVEVVAAPDVPGAAMLLGRDATIREGRFDVRGLARDTDYIVHATLDSDALADEWFKDSPTALTAKPVRAASPAPNVSMRVDPGATLRGSLLTEILTPVHEGFIGVFSPTVDGQLAPVQVTDVIGGRFSLDRIAEGVYFLGYGEDLTDPADLWLWPGVRDPRLAQPLVFQAGELQDERTFELSPADPTAGSAPVIEGKPRVGTRVNVYAGTWEAGTVFTRVRWFADDVRIKGADGWAFTPGADLVGARLRVEATGVALGHVPTTTSSDPSAPVRPR